MPNRKNLILAHERSGNHFLMESMLLNFDITKFHKWHHYYKEGPKLERFELIICMVRHGMDTLDAMYHWLSIQPANKEQFENLTFSEYLRGIQGATKLKGTDPIQHWCNFVDGFYRKAYTVRFEDLKVNPIDTLEKVRRHYNLSLNSDHIESLDRMVGHAPRKGIIGDYKNIFSEEDENYFWSKAEKQMYLCGYTKEEILYDEKYTNGFLQEETNEG